MNLTQKPKQKEPSPAEVAIRKIIGSSEQRCIALGSRYSELTLTDDQLAEVEDEMRKARMFEVLVTSETMRRAELDELKRRMMEAEKNEETKKQRQVVQSQLMRQRALQLLQKEAEAVKREEEQRLADDRRLLLQREKERLMDRRRRFEAEESDFPSDASVSRSGAAADRSTAPVLVMNVALGNGKEDRLVVRRYDDPKRVAMLFAKKHHLPESAVSSLTQQIRANLNAAQQREAQHHQRMHQQSAASRAEYDSLGPADVSPIHARLYETPTGGRTPRN